MPGDGSRGEKRARQASTRFCTIRDLIGRWPGPTAAPPGDPAERDGSGRGIPMRNIWWKPWRPGKRGGLHYKDFHKSAGKKKRPLNRNGWRPFFCPPAGQGSVYKIRIHLCAVVGAGQQFLHLSGSDGSGGWSLCRRRPQPARAIELSFSLNSSSWMPNSWSVAGIFSSLLKSEIFPQRLLMSACWLAPSRPILRAISA